MELLVLRKGVHRFPSEAYAAELRGRLEGHTVNHAATPAAERRGVTSADAVTGPELRPELIEAAGDVRLFACAYAGYGHLPLADLEAAGVAVTNAAGVHAPNAAEHAVGGLLALSRRLHEAARSERWQSAAPGELAGSTVGIVGLGAIGSAVAERLEPFDVTTLGIRRHPDRGGPTDEVFGTDEFHAVLARSDAVVLCCPLTEATRGLVGADELATMPPDAVLVNVARGAVVDTEALVSTLRRGRLGGAVLDVTDPEPLPDDHPLWRFDDVLVTPHSAGSTPKYYERLAGLVAENVERLSEGRELRNRVDHGESG